MVNTKKCNKCGIEKELSEFYKEKTGKYGVVAKCKVCKREYQKEYRQRPEVKQQTKEYLKEYAQKPEVKEYQKEYQKEYKQRPENKERAKEYQKEYQKEYRQRPEVKKRINEVRREYRKKLYDSDLNFKIAHILRTRLGQALKGQNKSASTLELLGCTIEFLKEYLASQFQEGMSWDNYSYDVWHIDHIRPCSSFDLTDPEQQKQCFHYTNLQPLWAKDNFSKGAKWENV